MSDTTKISWTDKTWSPWQGCTKVSPGCDHCYAENIADTRFHVVQWGAGQPRKHTENWDSPRRWNKQAAKEGRTRFFNLIRETPNLTWLILTKRIGNANKMLRESGAITRNGIIETPLPNLWLGATCVNQEEWNRDRWKLLQTPATKHFVSLEPLLGAIDMDLQKHAVHAKQARGEALSEIDYDTLNMPPINLQLDWVIAGGESGHGARPAHPDWFRSLRDQCAAAGVPFHFKQWGEWLPINQMTDAGQQQLYRSKRKARDGEDQAVLDDIYGTRCVVESRVIRLSGEALLVDQPNAWINGAMGTYRVGTKRAGRTLDGREHLEFPR
ncbi:MAG: DUF5131 family protein [Casimicrobium sp.]